MAYQNGKTYYIIPLCATGDAAYNQKILNKQVQPLSLNTRGSGNHYNNRNVNIYSLDWSTDMQWKVMVYNGFARILCAGDTSYGLDYYYGSSNPGNCDIYKVSGNDEDSKINFRTINASENLYRIQCYRNNADNDLYLTATGTSNGADVRWQPLDSSKASYQTWWLVPIENVSENVTPTPTVPNTPNEIKDQEFFVKAYGTNLNLNVYGTDTVANARNVNVYAKENCLAQKWIAKQTSAGPKLFTSINQAYALNINTADNNCTMYTASGNDTDSVLAFEEVADMLYRIKMNNHNKYLRVDPGAASGSNVYWVADINSATYWEFIPEDVMFPPEPEVPSSPDAPTTIVGNTYAVQANGTSYYLNVYGTDTVADGRNVNIYSKENCLAQKWVIRNTENGPKLFTKINENFALNIDASTDNCTMYTAVGNDHDSLLEFYPVGNMLYRIKMYNHNKYLCIDGTAATGTNVKWIEGATFATVWKLVPENNMTYDDVTDTDTTPDSGLVSSDRFLAMPAGYFMVGRDGHAISEITIHHTAGVVSSIENIRTGWINGDEVVSAHYCVKDNDIVQFVKERNTAYANGGTLKNPSAGNPNLKAVTIETCNSGGEAAGWPVSEDSLENLIKLVADIAKRNNMGTLVVGQNLKTHQDHAYTVCPGSYLLARMQYIADEANAINSDYLNGKIYLRKHNTNKFLGLNSYNEIVTVDKEDAASWKLMADGDKYRISNYDNPLLNLGIADDGVTPVLTENNANVFAYEDTDGTLSIAYESTSRAITPLSLNVFLAIDSNLLRLAFTPSEKEYFDVKSSADEVKTPVVSSIPEQYRNSLVRIKLKDANKYLTHTGAIHPVGYGGAVALKNNSFTEDQIWRIIRFDDNVFCMSPYTFNEVSLDMETTLNSCVTSNHGMYVHNSRAISIIPNSNGTFSIRLPFYKKYLACHPRETSSLVVWSGNDTDEWEIQLAGSEVANSYPTYVTNYLQADDIVAVKNLPATYAYSSPDYFEYFPKNIGMIEGTWLENNGADIEAVIKNFYMRVFNTPEEPINNYCLYGLYGGIYGTTTTPVIYIGAPHPGVDMVYKVNGTAVARDIICPFRKAIVADKDTYYVTLKVDDRFIKFVHLAPDSNLIINSEITFGTKLGVQSNKGNNVPIHLHIEASLTNTVPFDPADAINSPSNYTAATSIGDTISPYKYMAMIM